MSRRFFRWVAILQLGLTLTTGCLPTQPYFIQRDTSMADYLAQSMEIEYADVRVESLPEATEALQPLGPDHVPTEFIDLTLEDCISMALQNSKILRVVNGSNLQSGSISAALLSAAPGQMPSVYDPAITATTASTQPLAIDSQGNRIAPRGAVRANQVGGVEDALSEFDAQFSMLFGYNTTDRPRNVGPGNIFNPQFFQAVDANGQAALSKRMATGTIATARFTTVYSRNNIPSPGLGRNVPSDYTTALEVQVTQPLLRGRGTLVNRVPVVLARINEELQLHDFEANVRNLVKSVEDAYWDLYVGYRALEAAQVAQASALDLWRVAHARTQIGDTPPEAEAQARALYNQFRAQVHATLYGSTVPGNDPRGLYGREQTLREKIGWSATDGRLIRPADEPSTAKVYFDWYEVQAEALTRNTEVRRQRWAIKQREMELISAKNQILPQLDVTAFYRWLGVGDQLAAADRNGINFPNPGSRALEELTGGDYQELGARLELTPQAIGKRRALANIQNARLQIKKSQEELREKEMALMQEISTAWRNMESAYIAMQDYLDQWQANEDEIKIYNDKISSNVGELSQLLDLLLRAEERRSRAQLAYYQAVAEYNKSLVNIHYLKGTLLELNNIALEEGAWVEKAYRDAQELARQRGGAIYFDYGFTRPEVISRGPVPAPLTSTRSVRQVVGDREQAVEEVIESPEALPLEENPAPADDASAFGRDSAATTGGAVRVASAVRRHPMVNEARTASFDWGDMNLEASERTEKNEFANTAGSRTRAAAVVSSGGTTRMTLNSGISNRSAARRSTAYPQGESTSWSPRQ
ncbi:MAG: transporter [Pirellulaceae bacterium]|nr:MAG: transporter [Pirellulaceae bacterium]